MQFLNSKLTFSLSENSAFLKFTTRDTCKKIIYPFFAIFHQQNWVLKQNFVPTLYDIHSTKENV